MPIDDGWSDGGGERSLDPTYWESSHYAAIDLRDACIQDLEAKILKIEKERAAWASGDAWDADGMQHAIEDAFNYIKETEECE